MNISKVYSYLGALFGTGAGFGVGYGVGLLGTVGGEETVGALAFLYFFLILIMAGTVAHDEGAAAVVFIMGVFCMVFAFGGCVTYYRTTLHSEFVGVTPLFPLVLAIPFAAFGTITGYRVGRSIGEKADERKQERRIYQQKIEAYRRKLQRWEAEGYKVEELKMKWGFK